MSVFSSWTKQDRRGGFSCSRHQCRANSSRFPNRGARSSGFAYREWDIHMPSCNSSPGISSKNMFLSLLASNTTLRVETIKNLCECHNHAPPPLETSPQRGPHDMDTDPTNASPKAKNKKKSERGLHHLWAAGISHLLLTIKLHMVFGPPGIPMLIREGFKKDELFSSQIPLSFLRSSPSKNAKREEPTICS